MEPRQFQRFLGERADVRRVQLPGRGAHHLCARRLGPKVVSDHQDHVACPMLLRRGWNSRRVRIIGCTGRAGDIGRAGCIGCVGFILVGALQAARGTALRSCRGGIGPVPERLGGQLWRSAPACERQRQHEPSTRAQKGNKLGGGGVNEMKNTGAPCDRRPFSAASAPPPRARKTPKVAQRSISP